MNDTSTSAARLKLIHSRERNYGALINVLVARCRPPGVIVC